MDNCIAHEAEPGDETFVICANARFRLTVRQTVELNPAANAHGVEQTVKIKDVSNNQIVSQEATSDFYTGTHTIFTAQTSHEIIPTSDATGMGPFEGLIEHIPQCPNTGHWPGGGTLGGHGFAFLWYQFVIVQTPGNPGRAWYAHRPHDIWGCPSICSSPTSALIITVGLPDEYAVVPVPIAFWRCSKFSGGAESQTLGMCWDLISVD